MKAPWPFYFDFVAFPLLAIGLLAGFCRSWQFVGLTGLGFLLFTFAEYWIHRVALHQFFYHGRHERHHTHPDEYVAFPIWYSPLIFAGLFVLMPLPIFAGFVVGFVWFIYWHHILHHFDLSAWPQTIQRYAIWHLSHHRLDNCNYGITVPIWDFLFGTYRKS